MNASKEVFQGLNTGNEFGQQWMTTEPAKMVKAGGAVKPNKNK